MLTSIAVALLFTAVPKSDSTLVGTWLAGGAPFVTFNANGTGQMDDGAIKWTAAGGVISVTDNEGATDQVSYQLAGDQLTISMGGVPMTLTRAGKGVAVGKKGKLAQKMNQKPQVSEADADAEAMAEAQEYLRKNPPAPPPGTCEAACVHFAECAQRPDIAGPCVGNCMATGATPQQLAAYSALDCQQALQVVAQMVQQGQNQQKKRKNNSSQCAGCVRDGNDCVWISQGNWGSGYANPYSGAVSSCDRSCCGM
jgi:hypothetical protein